MNWLRTHRPLLGWGKNLPLALLLSFGSCGCKEGTPVSAKEGAKGEAADGSSVKFKAGKGLLLPEQTRKAIGLEIVEVSEQRLVPQVITQVQVYCPTDASGRAHALARLKADEAKQLKPGQSVRLQPVGDVTGIITGKVVRLDSLTEGFLGQTEVLLDVPDEGGRCVIGTIFKAVFDLGDAKSVTAIPKSAMLSAAEGPFVYVVNGQHFLRTLIKLGAKNEEWIEVTDGLYAGDKIVARPVETLWMTELRAVKGGGDTD